EADLGSTDVDACRSECKGRSAIGAGRGAGQARLQRSGIFRSERGFADHGSYRLFRGQSGAILRAADTRVDDCRRFAGDSAKQDCGRNFRAQVRSTRSGRGGKVVSADLLKALIDPTGVALVGASNDESKLTARPMRFLLANRFAGNIYPVNPGRETVLGHTAYPTVAAIPQPVDHAYLLVPTNAVEDALRDCANSGVKVVSILADGVAEAGEAGLARQARITSSAREAGIFLIGPNSLGVVNTHNGFICTTSAAVGASTIAKGGTAVLSQSGSIIGTRLSRGASSGPS